MNPCINPDLRSWRLVQWPESQEYIGIPGCVLINEDNILNIVGASAYLVPDIPFGPLFSETDRDIPQEGDVIYINGRSSDMSPQSDRAGGLATVKKVTYSMSDGDPNTPFVHVYEAKGMMNWRMLRDQQERLAVFYGTRWSYADYLESLEAVNSVH